MISEWIKKKIKGDDTSRYFGYREKFLESSGILKLYYYIRCKRIEKNNNSEIGLQFRGASAYFSSRPILPHGLNGIVISYKSSFGNSVIIMHQVTIGTAMVKEKVKNDLKAPQIGNNVYIGAGAKIIGDICIGDNVIIGANAVVVKDVPSGCTALGVPAVNRPNSNHYKN